MAPSILLLSSLAGVASGLMSKSLIATDPLAIVATFTALDTDRSGFVDTAEIQAFATSQGLSDVDIVEEFNYLDADGDGRLSLTELAGTMQPAEEALPIAASSSEDIFADSSDSSDFVIAAAPDTELATTTHLEADKLATSAAQRLEAARLEAERQRAELAVESKLAATPTVLRVAAAVPLASSNSSGVLQADGESSTESSTMWFTRTSRSAREAATRDAGSLFVEAVAGAMNQKGGNDAKAASLEVKAAGLRANITALIKQTPVLIEVAAKEAVSGALREPVLEARRMQVEADTADKKAVELRLKVRTLQETAKEQQNDILMSMKLLSSPTVVQ